MKYVLMKKCCQYIYIYIYIYNLFYLFSDSGSVEKNPDDTICR